MPISPTHNPECNVCRTAVVANDMEISGQDVLDAEDEGDEAADEAEDGDLAPEEMNAGAS